MEKWADYCISRVHYDGDHSKIIECEVAEDLGEKIGDFTKQRKEIIIANLLKAKTYTTIYKKNNGKWNKGDNVIYYKLDGEYFIRTDGNKTTKDNLGELPEY